MSCQESLLTMTGSSHPSLVLLLVAVLRIEKMPAATTRELLVGWAFVAVFAYSIKEIKKNTKKHPK